jgi:hypothetical protein
MNWDHYLVKSDVLTLELYEKCLRKIVDVGYQSFLIKDTARGIPSQSIIMRHDIEYSLECAVTMARLEAKHGICASYYVLLHAPFYNPYTPQNMEILGEILELGHEIGLHYETYFYEGLSRDVVQ